jgi:hypothetical protein
MANCTGQATNYTGRNIIVEVAVSCGDVDPKTLTYLPIGSTNQKDITVGSQTTDNTSDDTNGVTSTLVTFIEFSVTASGFATQADNVKSNQAAIKMYHVNEVQAGRQPTYFVRCILPDVTYYAFCNVTSTGVSGPTSDAATFNFEFSATNTGSEILSLLVEPTVA